MSITKAYLASAAAVIIGRCSDGTADGFRTGRSFSPGIIDFFRRYVGLKSLSLKCKPHILDFSGSKLSARPQRCIQIDLISALLGNLNEEKVPS